MSSASSEATDQHGAESGPAFEGVGQEAQSTVPRNEGGEVSSTIYVGNLFFNVTEKDLAEEFGKVGVVTTSSVIYDTRGLSKGFGFVTFSDPDAARRAMDMHGQYFEGRPLSIQYARRVRDEQRDEFVPTQTLFIGNMAFEMTDKDLNDLFRGIPNVTDVRVAIDRRTGQPRGFAHADFTDIPSATSALQILNGKEVFNRKLRVNYSVFKEKPSAAGSSDGSQA
ncbi:MAG: hypothetical protein M1826_005343 [Phylliscum demangeonii]|nr:MAG: hypothetical protein M1826_005343 [Phylliscum demangeonii]